MMAQHRFGDVDRTTERDSHYRALMDLLFDGTLITQDGRIVEINRSLLDLSGYSEDEIIGRSPADFMAEEYRGIVETRMARGIEGRADLVIIDKLGRRREVELVSRNVLRGGRPARIAALRDVTEKRHLEQRIRQAQKMEIIGRLASGVAHDFKNLLTIIYAYAGQLIEELDEPRRDDARQILKAAEAGAGLARQVLLYGRRPPARASRTDINGAVRDAEPMLRRLLGDAVELETVLAPDAGGVATDATQLLQVLVNLAVNAGDAMPRGGALIITTGKVVFTEDEARQRAPARAGPYVALMVTDTGTGMTGDVKAHIFEPLFTTKDAGSGSGLGLSIVNGIVEQAGGFIEVDSIVGAGSSFSVYLPRLDV